MKWEIKEWEKKSTKNERVKWDVNHIIYKVIRYKDGDMLAGKIQLFLTFCIWLDFGTLINTELLYACTGDPGYGPTRLLVTFCLCAAKSQNGISPSLLRLNLDAYCLTLIKADSVYGSLTGSCHINCLLSHCKHCKLVNVSRVITRVCQSLEHWEVSVWCLVVGRTMSTHMTDSCRQHICAHGNDYRWHSLASHCVCMAS